MKTTLLIVTGLMALSFPVHADQITQVNQADQADQAKVSQQAEPGQMKTGVCNRINKRGC